LGKGNPCYHQPVAHLQGLALDDAGGSKLPLEQYAERTELLEDVIVYSPNYGLLEITHNQILIILLNVYG